MNRTQFLFVVFGIVPALASAKASEPVHLLESEVKPGPPQIEPEERTIEPPVITLRDRIRIEDEEGNPKDDTTKEEHLGQQRVYYNGSQLWKVKVDNRDKIEVLVKLRDEKGQ